MKQRIHLKNTDKITLSLPPELHQEIKEAKQFNNINWSNEFRVFAQQRLQEIRLREQK